MKINIVVFHKVSNGKAIYNHMVVRFTLFFKQGREGLKKSKKIKKRRGELRSVSAVLPM